MSLNLHLTREERIAQIGELLSKGITLMLTREAQEKQDAEASTAAGRSSSSTGKTPAVQDVPPRSNTDETECAILDYLKRVGSASPRDVQRGLDIPKATAFRKLNRLLQDNLIIRSGSTTAIRYRLSAAASEVARTATLQT